MDISWTEIKTRMAERITDQVVVLALYHWMEPAHINYYILLILIWHFLRNYRRDGEYLRTNLETMGNEEREVRRLVDATTNGEAVLPRVQRWLYGVRQIRNDSRNRWKFLWKRIMHAEEIKAAVGKLMLQGRSIDRVSISEAKMLIFRNIVEALENNRIGRIGLYGERGVGQTTFVKEIGEEAKDGNLFKEVVTVTSSDQINFKYEIADQLGLTFPERYLENGKARWLLEKLEEKTSILVILNNVQAEVRWEEAGIPYREVRCNGCKILLVSENQDVCLQSGAERIELLN